MSTTTQIIKLDIFPDLLNLHISNPKRYPHLLESVASGTNLARFDILFGFPGEHLCLTGTGQLQGHITDKNKDFLDNLDHWCNKLKSCVDQAEQEYDFIPFTGGWFVYLGYELASQIEPTLNLPVSLDVLPQAYLVRCPAAIIRDHEQGCIYLVAETESSELIKEMQCDLESASSSFHASINDAGLNGEIKEDNPQVFIDGVEKIKDYIVEGDVFQVNLSRAWQINLHKPVAPGEIYHRLREHNPATFSGIASINNSSIFSSSPERLVQVKGKQIQTRPIAGTRPRGSEVETDTAFSAELLAHPKERAEHIMLIDLERNDLGRVCEPGSVSVNELMILESYAHVHHIVSNVCGQLRDDITPGQVIRAVFPGGTITGCPKVRCMQIIAELEGQGRGAYTGSMGYINRNGDMDLNILIRTLVQHDMQISLRAGAGIVADSIPEKELEETRDKARGLLLALNAV